MLRRSQSATTTSVGSPISIPRPRCRRQQVAGGGHEVRFDKGFADVVALGEEERVGHAPTDQEACHPWQQVLEHAHLVGDLGAANDRHEGRLGIVEQARQGIDLPLHQEAEAGRQEMGDTLGRGVGAVRGAERIVDVEIGEVGQFLGQGGIVVLLPRVEPEVLQQQDVTVLELVGDGWRQPGR